MAEPMPELDMNETALYREETITDQRAGTIRVLTPISKSGAPDGARKVIYIGQAQVMTPVGALPISFEIEAQDLAQAVAGYGKAAQQALERTARELEEMRREASSSIVVPGGGGMGMPGGRFKRP